MLLPGTTLQGRYEVRQPLGRGGMGAVYEARDTRFGRTVALKQALVTSDRLQRAFEREARLLNNLRHPALPVVIDYFPEGDCWFLVMDFVPGEDLRDQLQRRGVPFEDGLVAAWADQILDVLEYLHGHLPPIVHRDIKPANLKLTPSGQLTLLDFGLARGVTGDEGPTAGTSLPGYTPHFAPLEQINATTADPRSDLYSLGATLYCLLTAHIPSDAVARAAALASGTPDPLRPACEVNPAVRPALAEVIHRAMALTPHARPASARVMRSELAGAMHGVSGAVGMTQPAGVAAASWATTPVVPTAQGPTSTSTTVATTPQRTSRSVYVGGAAAVLAFVVMVGALGVLLLWQAGWFAWSTPVSDGGGESRNEGQKPDGAAPTVEPRDLEGLWIMTVVAAEGRIKTPEGWVQVPPEQLKEFLGTTASNTTRWQISFQGLDGSILETNSSGRKPTLHSGIWLNGRFHVRATGTSEWAVTLEDGALISRATIQTPQIEATYMLQGRRDAAR